MKKNLGVDMRRVFALLFLIMFVFCLSACGRDETGPKETGSVTEQPKPVVELTKETAEEFLTRFYTALLIDKDVDAVCGYAFPEDKLEHITQSYLSEFDDSATDFSLADYLKNELARGYEECKNLDFKILACEELSKAKNVYRICEQEEGEVPDYEIEEMSRDVLERIIEAGVTIPSGETIYVAAVRWTAIVDGEHYEETKMVSVYLYKGHLYIGGIFPEDWF